MKWTGKLDGEFNGSPCKIRVGVSETYSESDYNKNLREQRVNNVVKDYGNLGKTLGCFCKPKSYHGDVLVELVKGLGEYI